MPRMNCRPGERKHTESRHFNWWVALSLALAVSFGWSSSATAAERALLPTIKHKELAAAVAGDAVVLIQVGTDDERRGHLPGAIAYADIAADADVLPSATDTLIVLYCSGKSRDELPVAIADLKARGYTNLQRFSGGARGWREGGAKLDEGHPKKPKKAKKRKKSEKSEKVGKREDQ